MKKQLTVLFNSYPVAFDCPGGGEVQLMQCRNALQRRGVKVLLYNQWDPQFSQVDVAHYFSVQNDGQFCAHAKAHDLPVAVSPILWLGENKYDYDLYGAERLLRLCDIALPNSYAEGEKLSSWFNLPEEKFIPIVNGVDDIFMTPADPAIFTTYFAISTPFLLCIANIEPRKNQLRLIEASKELGVPVVLIGRIRDAEYWEACQAVTHDDVRYLGAVDFGSELHRSAYAACKAFLLPTRLETPGLAALEAAAQGAPICITHEGSTQEYFKDHAIYVNPESVPSIRAGLEKVCALQRSPELVDLVKSKFTWDAAAEQLELAYRKIIRG
jgi:glycosyltransferase involved in cell wall biosynthesis